MCHCRELSNVTLGNVIWKEGDPNDLVGSCAAARCVLLLSVCVAGDVNNTMIGARWTYEIFMNAFLQVRVSRRCEVP